MGAGDEEEHGTMLYNYLYYLQMQSKDKAGTVQGANTRSAFTKSLKKMSTSYPSDEFIASETLFLALGKASPEGPTVYA